ncbi:hypothetical protein SLE2022_266510 [Rubroshorea leprosula]
MSTRVRERDVATKADSGFQGQQGYRRRILGFSNQLSGQVWTFFFYNFPEMLTEKNLWYRFQRCGKVVDVFVPKKRDKWGKRFGFVRMVGVQNEYQMERKLNEIWFGRYKLRVNIANTPRKKISGLGKEIASGTVMRRMNIMVQPGQSYAQAVVRKGNWVEKNQAQGGIS